MNPDSPQVHLALFPTAIGACGIAWRGEAVLATHLPEATEAMTKARLAARAGAAGEDKPPAAIEAAIHAITALLAGKRPDLDFIACDFSRIDPFSADIYRITRAIRPGETRTYGAIAEEHGDKRLAQAVGRALGRNPLPIIVPCHRVMGANGRLTGFSANGGTATKLRMLAIEGAQPGGTPSLFDDLPLAGRPAR